MTYTRFNNVMREQATTCNPQTIPFDPPGEAPTTDHLDAYKDHGRPMLNNYTRYARVGKGHHGEVYLCYKLNPRLPHGNPERRLPVVSCFCTRNFFQKFPFLLVRSGVLTYYLLSIFPIKNVLDGGLLLVCDRNTHTNFGPFRSKLPQRAMCDSVGLFGWADGMAESFRWGINWRFLLLRGYWWDGRWVFGMNVSLGPG